MSKIMMKYIFYYRLNIRNDSRILSFCTVDKDLKSAVASWNKFKLDQTRIRELIKYIRVSKERVLN